MLQAVWFPLVLKFIKINKNLMDDFVISLHISFFHSVKRVEINKIYDVNPGKRKSEMYTLRNVLESVYISSSSSSMSSN